MGQDQVSSGDISAQIQGEVTGQLAVGNHIVQIGSVHGDLVTLAPPDKQPVPRARPAPVLLRPRAFADLLDRDAEIESAEADLASSVCVGLHGEPGVGKTAVLRHLAYDLGPDAFPDGVVYLSALHHPLEDVLAALFDALYECDVPLKPTQAQLLHALQGKRALVLLDDVALDRDEMQELMNAAPGCTFVFSSCERCLWGEGRDIELGGLPPDDALALIEHELGRPLTPEEGAAARTLCDNLGGHPLRILQAAATVREGRHTLSDLAGEVQGKSGAEQVAEAALDGLTDAEMRVLAALAALGDAPVGADHLAAITELPDVQAHLAALERRGLVQTNSPTYRLTGAFPDLTQLEASREPWAERALDHFAAWAEERRGEPLGLLEASDAIAGVLRSAVGARRWEGVVRLARAAEGAPAQAGRWGEWALVLRSALEAGRAVHDRAAEAWALHQLGTRALCLSDDPTAADLLGQALKIRESLGDEVGAAVTRHNLSLIGVVPPPSTPSSDKPSPKPSGGSGGLPPLALGGIVLLLAAAVVAVVVFYHRHGPEPPVQAGKLLASPTSLKFVNASVGEPLTVTVRYEGRGSVSVTATVEGNGAFTVFPATFTIDPATPQTLTVKFAPTSAGAATAVLRLSGQGPQMPKATVALSGTGETPVPPRPPVPTPVPPPVPPPIHHPTHPPVSPASAKLSVHPLDLSFGDVVMGKPKTDRRLTVVNDGTGDLWFALTFEAGQPFRLARDMGLTAKVEGGRRLYRLPPHASVAVPVMFDPKGDKFSRATLRIEATGQGHETVDLSGKGVPPPPAGTVSVYPSKLRFDDTPVGRRSGQSRTVTVSYDGLGRPRVTATVRDPRFRASPKTFAIDAERPQELTVEFVPTREGIATDRLVLAGPSARVRGCAVELSGRGVPPPVVGTLSVDPPGLEFGEVRPGEHRGESIVVHFDGQGRPTVTATVKDLRFRVFPKTFTLGPTTPRKLTVEFSPTRQGIATDRLMLASPSAKVVGAAVNLRGRGVSPPVAGTLSTDPTAMGFGKVRVGEQRPARRSVTVTYAGQGSPTVTATARDPRFSVSPNTFTLGPAKSRQLTVEFTPTSAGIASARLVLASPGTQVRRATVALSGRGVPPPPAGTLSVDPSRLSFVDTPVGRRPGQSRTVTVRYAGQGSPTVTATVQDPRFRVSPKTFMLGPTSTVDLTVEFVPTRQGIATDRLVLAGPSAQVRGCAVELSGEGVATRAADLAVVGLEAHMPGPTSAGPWPGLIRISGTVENVGKAAYNPPPKGGWVRLERGKGRLVMKWPLPHLEPGKSRTFGCVLPWIALFPDVVVALRPTYKLVVPASSDPSGRADNNEAQLKR